MLAALAATLVTAFVLLVAFSPEVQTLAANELAERRDDARRFLIADLLFVGVYAVLSPLAIWRFGRAAATSRPLIVACCALLVVAGLVDTAENALLLASTSEPSPDRVDAAHALSVAKLAAFAGGAVLALLVNARAVALLRAQNGGP